MQLHPVKKFKYPVPVFFAASETILKQCINNYDVLIVKRSAWLNPYFPDLLAQFQSARAKILGTDKFKALRDATYTLKTEQKTVLNYLSEFLVQFKVSFNNSPAQRDEILKTIGFTDNYNKAKRGNQESLIELLSKFNQYMTLDLQKIITDKKLDADLITPILGYAATFADKETNQEEAKGNKTDLSADIIKELNSYYDIIIGICKIARNKFKGNKQKQDLFSFSKTAKAIMGNKGGGENSDEDTPPVSPAPPEK